MLINVLLEIEKGDEICSRKLIIITEDIQSSTDLKYIFESSIKPKLRTRETSWFETISAMYYSYCGNKVYLRICFKLKIVKFKNDNTIITDDNVKNQLCAFKITIN